MSLTVAIAAESDSYDGEVYRFLAEMVLARPTLKWTGGAVFNGHLSVANQAPVFLARADSAGVKHAILAVDNDGGGRVRPEHESTHAASTVDLDDDHACRHCRLTMAIPQTWTAAGGKSCIVVPVQALETWLLMLRGVQLNAPSPERYHNRQALKRFFFGKPMPPIKERTQMALAELAQPNALTVRNSDDREHRNRGVVNTETAAS